MARYLLKRLLYLVGIQWALTLVIFGITQLLPGNVAVMILGQYQNPESLAAVSQNLG